MGIDAATLANERLPDLASALRTATRQGYPQAPQPRPEAP